MTSFFGLAVARVLLEVWQAKSYDSNDLDGNGCLKPLGNSSLCWSTVPERFGYKRLIHGWKNAISA
ncbi:hypothetical protein HK13_11890 [Acetobacter indonesiensis]|nr:hypothetical protein HK13_11890 [Acetobacter indonesiensis]